MIVSVTEVTNPFSFFCLVHNGDQNYKSLNNNKEINMNVGLIKPRADLSDVSHGQYVAVMWEDKWVRGIITMESQFMIWLVDYGIHLRPNNNTVYINLPPEHKKHPTKVFEASLHGVTPIGKDLTDDCQIKNVITNKWNKGATEKVQALIESAHNVHFVPVGLLSTNHNDVIIGDLYIEMKNRKMINIVDELERWPVFLEKNQEIYIKNLSNFYTSRRHHRACLLKPDIADEIPKLTLNTTLEEYYEICEKAPTIEINSDSDPHDEDGSTVLDYPLDGNSGKKVYKLTPAECEKYSNMYISLSGREYNVLNVLLNKSRDLYMCERYKDHDLKGVGRGCTKH